MEDIGPILEAIEKYLPALISFITLLANNPWAAGVALTIIGALGGTIGWWKKKSRRDTAKDRKNSDLQRDLNDLERDSTSADGSIRDRMRDKRKENE